jgi:hypothetical protein
MALVDEGRRVVAEQMEALEDLAAEARARREDMVFASNGHHAADAAADTADVAPTSTAGTRRAGGRRRAS